MKSSDTAVDSKGKGFLDAALDAARAAGKMLMEGYGALHQIDLKGKGDFVTEMDRRSEEEIIRRIHETFPDHAIVAEESGVSEAQSSYSWIIDPLDGTANYVRRIPMFAVSIGLMQGKEFIAGVIYNPALEDLFYAEKGKGAFRNDQPISVTSTMKLEEALLATGFPWRFPDLVDHYAGLFASLLKRCGGMRRMGSAAMDLAYTACGIFDCFWEMKLKPWDVAAGVIILREAGGVVSDFEGGKEFLESGYIVAGNPSIQREVVSLLR